MRGGPYGIGTSDCQGSRHVAAGDNLVESPDLLTASAEGTRNLRGVGLLEPGGLRMRREMGWDDAAER